MQRSTVLRRRYCSWSKAGGRPPARPRLRRFRRAGRARSARPGAGSGRPPADGPCWSARPGSVPGPHGHLDPHGCHPFFGVVGRGRVAGSGRVLTGPAGGGVDIDRPRPVRVRGGGIGSGLQRSQDPRPGAIRRPAAELCDPTEHSSVHADAPSPTPARNSERSTTRARAIRHCLVRTYGNKPQDVDGGHVFGRTGQALVSRFGQILCFCSTSGSTLRQRRAQDDMGS